jgi:SAM-dependent methyltransferase
VAGDLAEVLPPGLCASFDPTFIRSTVLYDEFVHRLVLQVFEAAGLDRVLRVAGTVDEIIDRAGLEPGRARIPLDWILRHLTDRGVLEAGPDTGPARWFRAPGPVGPLDPAPVRDEQARLAPTWLPSYVLAETVARDYPAFLRGEASGEAILFSPARFRLWLDYFSNDNGLYAVNNRVGAVAVAGWLPRGGGSVLELGGGLASGATALLAELEAAGRLPELREYRFTEVVPAFLRRGEQTLRTRHPGAAFLRFGPLDMNRPFADQGVSPGSFTLVYAVNTLHVAHDLAFTLGEIHRALAPEGSLVVSECVRPRPGHAIYVEFVFNLMETFRSPRLDPRHRPNGGFLTPEQWTASLRAAGFRGVRLLPDIVAIRDRFPSFYTAAIGATRGE